MHPYVASAIANEIMQHRNETARQARQARRRQRIASMRRGVSGR